MQRPTFSRRDCPLDPEIQVASDQTVPDAANFVRRLSALSPGLAALLAEHIADNNNEILPHVFFGDLTRYLVNLTKAPPGGDGQHELQRVLDRLEAGWATGGDDIQNVIGASFVENVIPNCPAVILERAGPMLLAELQAEAKRWKA